MHMKFSSLILLLALVAVSLYQVNAESEIEKISDLSKQEKLNDLLADLESGDDDDDENNSLTSSEIEHLVAAAGHDLSGGDDESHFDKRMAYRYGKRMAYRYGKKRSAMPYRFGKRAAASSNFWRKFSRSSDNSDSRVRVVSRGMAYRYGRSV